MASSPLEQVATPEQDAPPAEHLVGTPDKTSPELTAPAGWQKKIAPLKKGGTPKRRDVHFIAPDGEEVKSKRQLERYLKSHPGGPAVSEFDWSTGETPTRRSSRLSSKTRPSLDSPEGGSGGKRAKRKVVQEEEAPEDNLATEDKPESEVSPTVAGKEEVMEDVDKTEKETKTADSTAVPTIDANGDEEKDEEHVEKAVGEEFIHKLEACVEVTQVETVGIEEKKPEDIQIPPEEKSAGEQCEPDEIKTQVDLKVKEDNKDDEKSQPNAHSEVSFVEEQKEQEEADLHIDSTAEKTSSVPVETGFPQFSEAQNSSRPVGVSI